MYTICRTAYLLDAGLLGSEYARLLKNSRVGSRCWKMAHTYKR